MKNVCYIILTASIIIFACLNSDIIRSGCTQGLQLWYSSIVPILLPFMLLTGVITSFLRSIQVSKCCAYAIIFIIGLLCGFPTGTIIIAFFYRKRIISENVCQSLLPMCNNISPMFLYNYIYRDHLMEYISFARLIEAVYLPQIIYTVIALTLSCMSSHRSSTSTELLTAATVQVDRHRCTIIIQHRYLNKNKDSPHSLTHCLWRAIRLVPKP